MSIGQGSISYASAPPVGQGTLPGVTVPLVSFTVGDGQAGGPVVGSTSWTVANFQGQSLFNKQLLVEREGIAPRYDTPVAVKDIRRFNSGGLGGFTFEPASGLSFIAGETYNIFIVGVNNTIQV